MKEREQKIINHTLNIQQLKDRVKCLNHDRHLLFQKCHAEEWEKELKINFPLDLEDHCARYAWKEIKDNPREGYIWEELMHMKACETCLEAYELKLEIKEIKKKIGVSRSAITRMARNIINDDCHLHDMIFKDRS